MEKPSPFAPVAFRSDQFAQKGSVDLVGSVEWFRSSSGDPLNGVQSWFLMLMCFNEKILVLKNQD